LKNKFVIYANGSIQDGLGHLYRCLAIYSNFLKNEDCIFLHKNDFQRDFYVDRKLETKSISEILGINDYVFLLDTKEEDIGFIENLVKAASFSICVDTYRNWAKKFDAIVYPSFYYYKDLIDSFKKHTNVFYGKEFCILRKADKVISYKPNILLTFGGTDPNNLTLRILKLTQNKVDHGRITALIGKGFTHRADNLKEKFPRVRFIKDLKTTFEIIQQSNIIVTALGTTVQEVEFHQKRSIICFNYSSDLSDFKRIISHSSNKDLWINGGKYNKLNNHKIIYELNKTINNDLKPNTNKNWGIGWYHLLKNPL